MYQSQPKKIEVIPANSEIPCGCCGRFHRKIKKIDGWWMGGTCEGQYKLYMAFPDKSNLVWRGYEKQWAKINAMVHPQKSK